VTAPDDETPSTAEPALAKPAVAASVPVATEVPVSTYQPGLPKRERKPLNPALAILAGASLTAISGITATVLNIRSSERLSKERDKTDVAVQQRNDLEVKIGAIQSQLDKAKELLVTGSTVAAPITLAPVPAPLPSIVVVFPTNPPLSASVPPAATTITVRALSTLLLAPSSAPATTVPSATSTTAISTTSTSSPSTTTTIVSVTTATRPA